METTRNTFNFKKILVAMTLVLSLMLLLQGCSDSETNTGSKTTPATTSTKNVTKAQYEEAKKEHKQLVATNDELDKALQDSEKQKQQIESQQSQAENTTADEVNSTQDSANDNSANQADQNQSNTNNDTGIVHGGSSQYIIGNVNSHVYHMPGQRGYTMKSKNAVYFQSEQEAINAGYRKAKQ